MRFLRPSLKKALATTVALGALLAPTNAHAFMSPLDIFKMLLQMCPGFPVIDFSRVPALIPMVVQEAVATGQAKLQTEAQKMLQGSLMSTDVGSMFSLQQFSVPKLDINANLRVSTLPSSIDFENPGDAAASLESGLFTMPSEGGTEAALQVNRTRKQFQRENAIESLGMAFHMQSQLQEMAQAIEDMESRIGQDEDLNQALRINYEVRQMTADTMTLSHHANATQLQTTAAGAATNVDAVPSEDASMGSMQQPDQPDMPDMPAELQGYADLAAARHIVEDAMDVHNIINVVLRQADMIRQHEDTICNHDYLIQRTAAADSVGTAYLVPYYQNPQEVWSSLSNDAASMYDPLLEARRAAALAASEDLDLSRYEDFDPETDEAEIPDDVMAEATAVLHERWQVGMATMHSMYQNQSNWGVKTHPFPLETHLYDPQQQEYDAELDVHYTTITTALTSELGYDPGVPDFTNLQDGDLQYTEILYDHEEYDRVAALHNSYYANLTHPVTGDPVDLVLVPPAPPRAPRQHVPYADGVWCEASRWDNGTQMCTFEMCSEEGHECAEDGVGSRLTNLVSSWLSVRQMEVDMRQPRADAEVYVEEFQFELKAFLTEAGFSVSPDGYIDLNDQATRQQIVGSLRDYRDTLIGEAQGAIDAVNASNSLLEQQKARLQTGIDAMGRDGDYMVQITLLNAPEIDTLVAEAHEWAQIQADANSAAQQQMADNGLPGCRGTPPEHAHSGHDGPPMINGEAVPLQVWHHPMMPSETVTVIAPSGYDMTLNGEAFQSPWTAPEDPGNHILEFTPQEGVDGESYQVALLVMQTNNMDDAGRVNGVMIGSYDGLPECAQRNLQNVSGYRPERYQIPDGWVYVPDEAAAEIQLTPSITLGQVTCRLHRSFPKYTLISSTTLLKADRLLNAMREAGMTTRTVWPRINSAYRSPEYDRRRDYGVCNGRHTWGDALDLPLLADYNRDGRRDVEDADIMAEFAASVFANASDLPDSVTRYAPMEPGGIGSYDDPFIHIDSRGYRSRWVNASGRRSVSFMIKSPQPLEPEDDDSDGDAES